MTESKTHHFKSFDGLPRIGAFFSLVGSIFLLLIYWPIPWPEYQGMASLFITKVFSLWWFLMFYLSSIGINEINIEPNSVTIRNYLWRVVRIPNEAISKIKLDESGWIYIVPRSKGQISWINRLHKLYFISNQCEFLPFKQDLLALYGNKVVITNWAKKKIF